ncbi:hypothetical protein FGO68_gene10959 [Halteria grandinella]|uniref:Aquaporin n=1 Tax=Halteria grandinella TaxID=5974 RepID=A0A8J8NUI6_HALGN|nr:hypothetical protein FGO68_gene10959 [Halteria grandinella]
MDGAGKSGKDLLVIGLLEAIGTAILLAAVNFSKGNPLVVVTGILTGAILSGRLTGAHFNPGVTIAVLISDDVKKIKANLKLASVLIVSQLVGGYVGQAYSYMELGSSIAALSSPPNFSPLKVFLIELLFTFILMVSILHNIYPRLSIQSDTVLAVVSVILCVYFCIRCAGPMTGACFNPCVALVNVPFVALVRMGSEQPNFLEYLPSYVFGPLIGAILAGIFCKFFIMPHVPHYYDTMLSTFREDLAQRYSNVDGNNSLSVYENSQEKALEKEKERLLLRGGSGVGDKQ